MQIDVLVENCVCWWVKVCRPVELVGRLVHHYMPDAAFSLESGDRMFCLITPESHPLIGLYIGSLRLFNKFAKAFSWGRGILNPLANIQYDLLC